MKKLLFCALLSMLSLGVSAQSYDLEDLMYFLDYYYVDDIVEDLEESGYTYSGTEYDEEYDLFYIDYYDFDQNNDYRALEIYEDRDNETDDVYALDYVTSVWVEYNTFWSELRDKGFERINDEFDDNSKEFELHTDFEYYYAELYRIEKSEGTPTLYGIYIYRIVD